MKKIHELQFRIAKGWVVAQNNFYQIEPDSKYPKVATAGYLSGPLFQGMYGEFLLYVAFYGTYHLDREGRFGLHLIRGNFHQGMLLEKHNCRQLSKIRNLTQDLLDQVAAGTYNKTKGLKFGEDSFLVGLKSYSAKGLVKFEYW